MGDKNILMEMVEKTRREMRDAQDAAIRTPRPIDACPSHDALFALTRAQTNALDALLMLKQEEMADALKSLPLAAVEPQKEPVKAALGRALAANMKTAIICFFVTITACWTAVVVTRQISEAGEFVGTTTTAIREVRK